MKARSPSNKQGLTNFLIRVLRLTLTCSILLGPITPGSIGECACDYSSAAGLYPIQTLSAWTMSPGHSADSRSFLTAYRLLKEHFGGIPELAMGAVGGGVLAYQTAQMVYGHSQFLIPSLLMAVSVVVGAVVSSTPHNREVPFKLRGPIQQEIVGLLRKLRTSEFQDASTVLKRMAVPTHDPGWNREVYKGILRGLVLALLNTRDPYIGTRSIQLLIEIVQKNPRFVIEGGKNNGASDTVLESVMRKLILWLLMPLEGSRNGITQIYGYIWGWKSGYWKALPEVQERFPTDVAPKYVLTFMDAMMEQGLHEQLKASIHAAQKYMQQPFYKFPLKNDPFVGEIFRWLLEYVDKGPQPRKNIHRLKLPVAA